MPSGYRTGAVQRERLESCVYVCLVQIHLKNRELENTKLSAELQMLKSVDVNKENTIAQLKEELSRVKSCLAEKDKQHRQLMANSSPSVHQQQALGTFYQKCTFSVTGPDTLDRPQKKKNIQNKLKNIKFNDITRPL